MVKQAKQNQKTSKSKKNLGRRRRPQRKPAGNSVSVQQALAPVASASVIRVSKQGNMSKFRISERIASVVVDSTTPTGEPLLELLLNPTQWVGSRIAQEASLWQQYRFTRLSIRAIPGIPTICSGQYLHGADAEAENMNLSSDALIAYMSNLPGAVMAPVWKETACQCPVEAYLRSQAWYRLESTNPSLPDYCQGLYLFTLTQAFSGISAGSAGFTIWADGEVEFCGRRISSNGVGDADSIAIAGETGYHLGCGGGTAPYNDAGRYYFTSGTNDVDKTKVGYAYVIEPLQTFPAMDIQGESAPVYAGAMRRGPGNGNAYFYRTLAGALAGDATELMNAIPTTEVSNVYMTGDGAGHAGYLHPVKLPASSPSLFRTQSRAAQPAARGKIRASQHEDNFVADIAATLVSTLATLGVLSVGPNNKQLAISDAAENGRRDQPNA